MMYTVWRHDVLLGTTDLAMSTPTPEARMGQLEPTPEFARAWAEFGPIVKEFFSAGEALGQTMAELPPAPDAEPPSDRARRVYDWLAAHPSAARVRDANEQMKGVALELRDPTGRQIPTESILIQELRPPAWIPPEAIEQTLREAREDGVRITVPSYVVIVEGLGGERGGEPPLPSPQDGKSGADLAAWNRAADAYATAAGGPNDRIYTMLRAVLWESLGPDVRGMDVLDLGCGHGWLSAHLVAAGARVHGIDGSQALLAHAREIAPGADFAQYDLAADALPTDRRYDRIVAHMVLMDLPRVDHVLSFVRSVLKPRGRFVFTMPHPCFFNYKTRTDPATGHLYCGVADYLHPAEWWIETYGGHRHYHRSLTFYIDALREHGLAVTRLHEPPQLSRDPAPARVAFYQGIPKFILIEASHCNSPGE